MASTTAVTSLASKVTGTGSTVDFLTAKSRVSAVMVVRGTVTAGQVQVQASQDGTNWVSLITMAPMTGVNQAFDQNMGAYRYYRAVVVSTVTGSGSVDVTFMEGN